MPATEAQSTSSKQENTMSGIHHVTAIAGNALRNYDFYTRSLGLRFVKKTVNFDDPGTYHFYYGDETGRPGTILTFSAFQPARWVTGPIASSTRASPMRRWKNASANPCCPSPILTG